MKPEPYDTVALQGVVLEEQFCCYVVEILDDQGRLLDLVRFPKLATTLVSKGSRVEHEAKKTLGRL